MVSADYFANSIVRTKAYERVKEKANEALRCLSEVSVRGGTEQLLLALSNYPEAVFYVVHDESFRRKCNMEFPFIEFITPDDVGSKTLGRPGLILDHYCLFSMVRTIATYIEELEKQIVEEQSK